MRSSKTQLLAGPRADAAAFLGPLKIGMVGLKYAMGMVFDRTRKESV